MQNETDEAASAVTAATPPEDSSPGTADKGEAAPSGFKHFVARRKESLVNLVRRSSSNASLDNTPAPSPLFGRKGETAPLSAAEQEADANAAVLKQAALLVVERKKVKTIQFVLTSVCLKAADGSARLSLRDLTAVMAGGGDQLEHGFTMATAGEKLVVMWAESEEELQDWMLAIGAACVAFGGSLGVLSHSLRVKFEAASIERLTGGILKRDEIDEEWQYRKSGMLVSQGKVPCSYQWSGGSLSPVKGPNYGRGEFDGLVLTWYAPLGATVGFEKKKKKKKRSTKKLDGVSSSPSLSRSSGALVADEQSSEPPQFERQPCMSFMYLRGDKSYQWFEPSTGEVCKNDPRNWKWSRHFLTKCVGLGHWINEGSCPPHLVMLLQMMRFCRVGWAQALATTDSDAGAAALAAAEKDKKTKVKKSRGSRKGSAVRESEPEEKEEEQHSEEDKNEDK